MNLTRKARIAAVSAVAAATMSVAGCSSDPVPGTPSGTTDAAGPPAASAAPAGPPDSANRPGGTYSYVEGLCERIDFSAVEDILPFSGPMDARERGGGPYSSAQCHQSNEARDGRIAGGATRVKAQWLPTPRLAAEVYEDIRTRLAGEMDRKADLPGSWERATLGTGDPDTTTAAYVLLQDSNLVIEVQLSFSMVEAEPQAAAAVQRVAESILSTSASA